jgi:hypothetical protein
MRIDRKMKVSLFESEESIRRKAIAEVSKAAWSKPLSSVMDFGLVLFFGGVLIGFGFVVPNALVLTCISIPIILIPIVVESTSINRIVRRLTNEQKLSRIHARRLCVAGHCTCGYTKRVQDGVASC